ncbi:hypothetical protein ACFL6F_03425 [Planctomycetota bacterium]
MLPYVEFCGLNVTRVILGANPFGGFSHQNKERDEEMRSYYTVERIIETWNRAEAAGINAMVTNNETEHVLQAVEKYLSEGGKLQWIAQINNNKIPNMFKAIDQVAEIGARAIYFHGALIDEAYHKKNKDTLRAWCDYVHSRHIPVGVAGHSPDAHLWVDRLDIADFHAVCFFNCGSLHVGKGDKFELEDLSSAVEAIKRIRKPCIGYKIMGAGRIDPRTAFEYAFRNIKPADVVNVGVYRGDKDNMIEENISIAEDILNR